ncbi:MAG: hypothetical protein R3F59_10890 [Myxococcota bacterium]
MFLWLVACHTPPAADGPAPAVITVEMRTSRTFRGDDPRKADTTITGVPDRATCETMFETSRSMPPPSDAHTLTCSDLSYDDGVCRFYCEIEGPL